MKFGRKKKLTPAQIIKARRLIEHGERVEDVAALWNVGRTTLYIQGACRLIALVQHIGKDSICSAPAINCRGMNQDLCRSIADRMR